MDYDNTNKGILFNEQAKKSERSPDWTGKLDVEGKEYRIAAWERTTKTGTPILSLAISEPQEQAIEEDKRVATDAPKQSGREFAREVASKFKKDEVAEVDGDEDMKSLMENIPF